LGVKVTFSCAPKIKEKRKTKKKSAGFNGTDLNNTCYKDINKILESV
jgi:hypothetical protein